MNIVSIIDFLRRNLKTVVRIAWVVLALLVAADAFLVDKEHAHTKPEHWPAFWAAFGFVACLLIIFFSKWYGHRGIMRSEDYYGDEE